MEYATVDDVKDWFADLCREAMEHTVQGALKEACFTVDSDLEVVIDISGLHKLEKVPGVVWRLAIYKARELAYIVHYGGSIPEDGGQVKHWHTEYRTLLGRVLDGQFDGVFGKLVIKDRGGRLRAV
jgi:hypothetical protein